MPNKYILEEAFDFPPELTPSAYTVQPLVRQYTKTFLIGKSRAGQGSGLEYPLQCAMQPRYIYTIPAAILEI
jgi:hypothetical protein